MKRYSWKEVAFLVTWGLYFALILLPDDHGASQRVLNLIIILSIVIYRHYRSPIAESKYTRIAIWGLIAYLLITLISTLIPGEVMSLQFSDRRHMPGYAVLITVSVLLAARSSRMIGDLLLVLVAVFGVFFAAQLLATPWWESFSPGVRFSGITNAHPNRLGMTLLILPSLGLGALGFVRNRGGRFALIAGAALIAFFLFLTKSRSCLLVFGLVNVPLGVLLYGRRDKWKSRILVVSVIICLLVPLTSYLWLNQASDDRNSPIGIYGRFEAWQTSIALSAEGPWYRALIGHGIYRQGFYKLAEHYGRTSLKYPGEPVHAHNSYLQTLVESGVLGLASLLVFTGSIVLGLIRCYRTSDQDLVVTRIMLVSMVTILAMGFLDYNLHDMSGRLHYGIIALAAASISGRAEPQAAEV